MEESLNGNRLYDSVERYSLTRKGLYTLVYEEDDGFNIEISAELVGSPKNIDFGRFEFTHPEVGKRLRERILKRIRACMAFWNQKIEISFLDTMEMADGTIAHFHRGWDEELAAFRKMRDGLDTENL